MLKWAWVRIGRPLPKDHTGKENLFTIKCRSFLKDKQSIGFDPQGIYIYAYMYLCTTLIYKACKLTCLKNYLKYNYVSLRFSICSPYTHTISHLLVVFSPLRLPVGVCSLGGGLPLQLFVPPFPLVFLLHPRCGPLCFPSFSHSLGLHQP